MDCQPITAGARVSGQIPFCPFISKKKTPLRRAFAQKAHSQLMVRTMGKDRTVFGQAVALLRARRGSQSRRALGRLWRDNAAVTSVEYAVMLALILGIILVSIKLLGTNTKALWTNNSSTLQGAGLGS
jgi:Flp pilus assembly pilin Flp